MSSHFGGVSVRPVRRMPNLPNSSDTRPTGHTWEQKLFATTTDIRQMPIKMASPAGWTASTAPVEQEVAQTEHRVDREKGLDSGRPGDLRPAAVDVRYDPQAELGADQDDDRGHGPLNHAAELENFHKRSVPRTAAGAH